MCLISQYNSPNLSALMTWTIPNNQFIINTGKNQSSLKIYRKSELFKCNQQHFPAHQSLRPENGRTFFNRCRAVVRGRHLLVTLPVKGFKASSRPPDPSDYKNKHV